MKLEKIKEAAVARLRSASGHLSVEIPLSITIGSEEIRPKELLEKSRDGSIGADEKEEAVVLLRSVVSSAEQKIGDVGSAEEVDNILQEALGVKRVLHILRGGAQGEGRELEDARRWHRYVKKIK